MGQVLHGSACTTEAVRRAIQHSLESLRSLAKRHGINPKNYRAMRAEKVPFRCHSFEAACAELGIEHRLTKPRHPWTNGQVERMNRTIKDATVKRFHYESHDQLRQHLVDFVAAYNFGRRLKTLKGLTPYEFICQCWTKEPARFILNPLHQMPGLNN